jgi:hypothetical protein
MKSNRFVKGLLGPIVVGLLGLVLGSAVSSCSPQTGAQAQAPKKGPVWEYAEIERLQVDNKWSVSFTTGEKFIEGANWGELAKKMQLKPGEDNRHAIFDHLGSQGWEMFSAGPIPSLRIDGGIHHIDEYWLFKRIRP